MAWRLEIGDNSLLVNTLKQRYFRHGTFLQSDCKRSASWIWKNLNATKPIINLGLRWRICDGQSVDIWSDPWLPGNAHSKISSKRDGLSIQRVSELINAPTHSWKTDVINTSFNLRDRRKILQVPISLAQAKDRKYWGWTKSGVFSGKSAYFVALRYIKGCNVARQERVPPETECSYSSHFSNMWKDVWKILAFRKVQFFLWQCLHEKISVNTNLKVRRMVNNSVCTRSILVLYLGPDDCSLVEIWKESGVLPECRGLAAFICWHIWKSRNIWGFHSTKIDPNVILDKALQDFSEHREAKSLMHFLSPHPTSGITSCISWHPPPEDVTKINIDASFNLKTKESCGALVMRNHEGVLHRIDSIYFSHVPSAIVAEGLTLRTALKACLD
ncbi:uncharacterized protein LOC132272787 [Cornus florida]|uniref:uncharacterized protein LOC132272787 n=1 Tax=Cornus florida TaxID=4283 RepID=UPI0028969E5C|nr:uncharacterized protein LOC132272787 [Cornus florida]